MTRPRATANGITKALESASRRMKVRRFGERGLPPATTIPAHQTAFRVMLNAMSNTSDLIEFFHILPRGPLPVAPDPTLDGSIPIRAFRYCEPFTTANALGWHLFPPFNFDIKWDGMVCEWRRPAPDATWHPLRKVVPPEFANQVKTISSDADAAPIQSMPFLSHAPEHGIIQMWSGLVVKTKPGWASLVRPLANFPHEGGVDVLDGVIETDIWVGPLLSVMRMKKTDVAIQFRTTMPYAQLQLVNKEAYAKNIAKENGRYAGLESWPEEVREEFGRTLSEFASRTSPGSYKRLIRSRSTG